MKIFRFVANSERNWIKIMHRKNLSYRSAQSNTTSPKGKYIANLILILAAARRNVSRRCSIELRLFDFNVVDVASYSLGKLPGGRWNCEQIRATSTTN